MGYLVQAKAALYLFEGPFIFSLCICLSYPASQHLVKSPQSIIVSYLFLSNESRKCRVDSSALAWRYFLLYHLQYIFQPTLLWSISVFLSPKLRVNNHKFHQIQYIHAIIIFSYLIIRLVKVPRQNHNLKIK